MDLVAVGRTERAVRHHRQVEEAGGMETDQAPRVGEDIRLRRRTYQVAQINPRLRRVLLRGGRRASNPARRAPRRMAGKIRCSVRSNAPRSARGMR
jgi:hypothetical protein